MFPTVHQSLRGNFEGVRPKDRNKGRGTESLHLVSLENAVMTISMRPASVLVIFACIDSVESLRGGPLNLFRGH